MANQPVEHVRNIAVAVILSLVTCGIYNIYWQYLQIQTVNDMLKQDKYSFWPWFGFSIITCGLYHIYHEYRMSEDIAKVTGRDAGTDSILAVVLAVLGLSIVVDAIQQSHMNAHYGNHGL